jgi:hypothetical protein
MMQMLRNMEMRAWCNLQVLTVCTPLSCYFDTPNLLAGCLLTYIRYALSCSETRRQCRLDCVE